ncbi:DUF2815 family protein [Sinorhizobium medicae]|nr:DUF2815 family protein [Sinorhizobium medicae]
MTDKKPQREGIVTLKNVRLSFPHLFEPSASIEDGPKKYRATFLMDPKTTDGKANIAKLKAVIDKAALGVWKTKEKADKIRAKLDSDRSGLRDGDDATNKEGDVYAGYEDMMFIGATNGRKPKVIRRDKSVIDSSEASEIYGGCYVNAVISVWATNQEKHGGNGIFATLEIVQYAKKGEPFGAAELDEDDFLDDMGEEEEEEEDGLV